MSNYNRGQYQTCQEKRQIHTGGAGYNGRRFPVCRSAFMRSEEIDREREQSGWNPYRGEEEYVEDGVTMPGMAWEHRDRTENGSMMPGMDWEHRDRTENGSIMPGIDWEHRDRTEENENMQPGMMNVESRMPNGDESMQPGRVNGDSRMPDEDDTMEVQPYFRMPDYDQVLEEMKMTERDLRMLQTMYPETAKSLLPYIEEECDKLEYEGSMMYDEHPDPTTIQRIQETIWEEVRDQFPEEPEEEPDDILTMQYGGRGNRRRKNRVEELIRIMLLQEMHHRRCRHGKCRRRY